MTDTYDIAIVGAGVAGLSLAAELAGRHRVVVLEAEDHPATHATGRSAALYTKTYGDEVVRGLTAASEDFFRHPPAGFADASLVSPKPCVYVGGPGGHDALRAFAEGVAAQCPRARLVERSEMEGWQVPLDPAFAAFAVVDPDAMDIDVHALITGFQRRARIGGVVLRLGERVERVDRRGGRWRLAAVGGDVECGILVNAAGAWADTVARGAGVAPLGLEPRRRTMICVESAEATEVEKWPFVVDLAMTLYFKPDAGRLIVSPADETPCDPGDVQPEEWDVAVAVDRFERATGMLVGKLVSRWAGLRTFAADERPVAGFDCAIPDFFWLAGQGGFGVQTAPAIARYAAAVIDAAPTPLDLEPWGLRPDTLSPSRLWPAAACRNAAPFPIG